MGGVKGAEEEKEDDRDGEEAVEWPECAAEGEEREDRRDGRQWDGARRVLLPLGLDLFDVPAARSVGREVGRGAAAGGAALVEAEWRGASSVKALSLARAMFACGLRLQIAS